MKHRDGAGLSVLAFFLCFFFLLSSGRIASQDAGQQLQVAVLLATTGALGQDARDAGPADASWVRAPNGRFYQAHDIGNVVLMLPGAWLGARLSAASDSDDILNPPALSRAGASLACAAIAALGCFWMFRLFSCFWPVRTAFLLSVAFPATTIFMAYSRAAWDVLGGCCFMCGAVVTVIKWERLDRELRQLLSIYGAAAACYVLLISKMANWGAFGWGPRYLMPVLPLMFLAAACGLMLAWPARRRAVLALAALSALLTVPPAIVNWHLATTSFAGAADPDAPTAAQQRAAWSALVRGVQGQALPVPPNAAADSLRATTSEFPDLFLWRLARISAMGMSAAVIAVAAALWIGAVTARRILGVGPPDVRSAEL